MDPTIAHQALYRRWRAQTFGQIVGQEAVVETLRNAVRAGKVAHAMLFVGPRGTGKTSMARIVAKALNCTDLKDGEPCDVCPACVSIREGRALDVIELDAASNNRVDDIRELIPRIYTAPSDLRRKVFIVDEVQRIKEGWDLLLKTLEEPPDHVAFIFCTTDASGIRPAVLSRIQRFDFRRLTTVEIEGKLRTILEAEGRAADDETIALIAGLAAGGMRDAESILDQLLASGPEALTATRVRDLLGLAEREAVDGFADALVAGDPAPGLAILADLEDRGRDLRVFLDQVVESLRDRITTALSDPARRSELPPLASAATRLGSIDTSRLGPGGLRLQLELALLSTSAEALAIPAAATAPAVLPAAVPTGATRRPSRAEPAAAATADAPEPPGPVDRSPEPAATAGPAAVASSASPAVAPEPAAVASSASPAVAPEPASGPPAQNAEAPAPEPTPISDSDAAPPTPVEGDAAALVALRDQWPEIVAYISQHPPTKPLISACRPIAVDGAVVTLGFPEGKSFYKEIAERRRANLEEGIGHFLGRPVAVRCVATNIDIEAPLPTDGDAGRLVDEARRIFADDLVDVGEVG